MIKDQKFSVRRFLMNNALYVIMFLMVIVITCISPKFLSVRVLRDILTQSSTLARLAAQGCACRPRRGREAHRKRGPHDQRLYQAHDEGHGRHRL